MQVGKGDFFGFFLRPGCPVSAPVCLAAAIRVGLAGHHTLGGKMDNIVAGLMLLGLIAFGALCAVESCCRHEPFGYEAKQELDEARGEGYYFVDRQGRERFIRYDALQK